MPQTAERLLPLCLLHHWARADLFVLTRRSPSASRPAIGIIGATSSPVAGDVRDLR